MPAPSRVTSTRSIGKSGIFVITRLKPSLAPRPLSPQARRSPHALAPSPEQGRGRGLYRFDLRAPASLTPDSLKDREDTVRRTTIPESVSRIYL
jgi:hypothetical protein